MAHFSAEIAGDSASEKWAARPFISARCLWCLGYLTAPADLTPGFYRGQSGHTSPISGDHTGLRSLRRGSSPPFRWTDRSRRRRWWLVEGAWQQLLCAEVAPRRGLWITVPQALAKNWLRQIYGTTTLLHLPPILFPKLRQAPPLHHHHHHPLVLSVFPLCALWPREALWPGSGREECTKHTRRKSEKIWVQDSAGGVGRFLWRLYPKLSTLFWGFKRGITLSISSPAQKHSYSPLRSYFSRNFVLKKNPTYLKHLGMHNSSYLHDKTKDN